MLRRLVTVSSPLVRYLLACVSLAFSSLGMAVGPVHAAPNREPVTLTWNAETAVSFPLSTPAPIQPPLHVEITPPLDADVHTHAQLEANATQVVVYVTAHPTSQRHTPDPVTWAGTVTVYDAAGRSLGERHLIMVPEAHDVLEHPRDGWATRARWWFAGQVVLLAAVALGVYSVIRRRPWWWKRRLPHARLVPADSRTRQITAPQDLRGHCVKKNRLRLLIGIGEHCDIRLAHDDVHARHAWITMLPDRRGGATTKLIPIDNALTLVNGETARGAVTLNDGDELAIGALHFVFQLAEFYRPVVVEYRDGSRASGFPLTWDTLHPAFRFRDSSAAVSERGTAIAFERVRAVHFVSDWDESVSSSLPTSIPYPRGKRAQLQFEDGSIVEGWLTPDYEPDAPRFHFLPEPSNGIIVSLVERAALQGVILLDGKPQPDLLQT